MKKENKISPEVLELLDKIPVPSCNPTDYIQYCWKLYEAYNKKEEE